MEGSKIFELQREQVELIITASRSIYIPGSQSVYLFNNILCIKSLFKVNYDIFTLKLKIVGYFFRVCRFLPTKSNKWIKAIYKEVKVLISSIIDKRVIEMKATKSNKDDLLGILLDVFGDRKSDIEGLTHQPKRYFKFLF